LIAIGLGIVLGIVAMFYNGIQPIFKNIVDYVLYGFMAGAGAVGLWEGFSAVKSGSNGAAKAAKTAAMILVCIFLAMSMTSCSMITRTIGLSPDLEKQWQAATEEERVRLVLKDIQSGLDSSLDMGTLYVAAHPEKKADWKNLVLPLFKKANDVIGDVIREAKTTQGKVTLAGALLKIQPHMMEIERILLEWRIKK
jgi:hypothetical protein